MSKQEVFDDQASVVNKSLGIRGSFSTPRHSVGLSARQKDPSKSPSIDNKAVWSKIDDSPSKAVINAVSPRIIQLDREACDTIVRKLNEDRQLEGLQKDFLLHNRLKIR
jgi:hypothetical protein